MARWMTTAATALASLALAACGSDDDQLGPVPASEAAQGEAAPSAEELRAAVDVLEEMCRTRPVAEEGDETPVETPVETPAETPAAIDVAVDDLIRTFYLVDDRSLAEDDVREALDLLAEGCASSATAQRLAVATGVEPDEAVLEAAGRPQADAEGTYDCDAQGINAQEGAGGTCLSATGDRVTVADRGEPATTPAMAVTLLDVETPRSLRRKGEAGRRANGAFVLLTLQVRNRLEEKVEFDPAGQVELYLEGQPYFSIEEGTTTIDPGESRTGTVAFDVPEDVVDSLETSGNVFVKPFAQAAFEGDQATIAVLRTYK